MNNQDAIPKIILATGDRAVAVYLDFFSGGKWTPNTLKLYGQHARRFFRWAEGRGLTLQSIAEPDINAYATEVANGKSPHESSVYLTPVRGVFSQLVSSGVLSQNPCGTYRPSPKQVADGGFPAPKIPLSELKRTVLEIGKVNGWEEGDEDVQAGLVMMAEFSIDTRDPAAISRFTGVPLPLVEEFAGRLIANGIWLPDGKIAADWDDPEDGWFAFMLDVWVATGLLNKGPAPAGDFAALPGDETGLLSSAGQPAGERSDGR